MVRLRTIIIGLAMILALCWRPEMVHADGRIRVRVVPTDAVLGVSEGQALLLSDLMGAMLSETDVFDVVIETPTEFAAIEDALSAQVRADREHEAQPVDYYYATELAYSQGTVTLRGRLVDAESGASVYAFDLTFPEKELPDQIDVVIGELTSLATLLRFGLRSENIETLVDARLQNEAYSLLRLVQQVQTVDPMVVSQVYALRADSLKSDLVREADVTSLDDESAVLSNYLALLDGTDPDTAALVIDARREQATRRFQQLMSDAKDLSEAGQYEQALAALSRARTSCPDLSCFEETHAAALEFRQEAADALVRRGRTEARHGRQLLADEYFQQALALATTHPGAISGLSGTEDRRRSSAVSARGHAARKATLRRPAVEPRSSVAIGGSVGMISDPGFALDGTGSLVSVEANVLSVRPMYRPLSLLLSGSGALLSGGLQQPNEGSIMRRLGLVHGGMGLGFAFDGLLGGVTIGPHLGIWGVAADSGDQHRISAAGGITANLLGTLQVGPRTRIRLQLTRQAQWVVNRGRIRTTSVGFLVAMDYGAGTRTQK